MGGCTLIRKGRPAVWTQLPKIMAAHPDIVIISLGTNDTCGMGTCGGRKCWEYKDEFSGDYSDLNTPLGHKQELFAEKDGVHPNYAGYKTIAELVYQRIK